MVMAERAVAAAVTVTQPLVEFVHGVGPYGSRVIITEKAGPVAVETMKLVEKTTRGKGFIQELADGRYRVRAKAQHVGVKNRNNRVYPPPVWEQHLTPGTPFQTRIGGRGMIGHLEHPGDGKSQMPLGAIVVTEASPPDENGEIWITFETLTTPPGKIVEAYIRCRVRFGLSSRGNGSVQNRGGVDEVQMDFDPIGWDCVIDESTPGAEVSADEALRESLRRAWADLSAYVKTLNEKAHGDQGKVLLLAESDARKAAESLIDCPGGVCRCPITEEAVPPSGYSKYLLNFADGSAHYRAYHGTTGQWEVWMHAHNLLPQLLASKIPTLDACQHVAENHYKLVLLSGALSAQQHAARSNAIGREAAEPADKTEQVSVPAPNIRGLASVMREPVPAPNIGGMSAMMGRYSAPAGPGPVTGGRALSLESIGPQWQQTLVKLQESWQDALTLPYSGTVMEIRQADTRVLPAIKQAGMVASSIAEGVVQVYSPFESGKQAVTYVHRILERNGLQANVRAAGAIRDGRIVMEGDMDKPGNTAARLREAGNEDKAPGDMAGGDTVPEVTDETPEGISPEYKGEDPMDLDLDLDVNEDAKSIAEQGDDPLDIAMNDDGEEIDYDEPMDMGDVGDDSDEGEPGEMFEPVDTDMLEAPPEELPMSMEAFEAQFHKLMEAPANRGAAKAMFAKAFGANKRASVARGDDKYYGTFRVKYAKANGLNPKAAGDKGDRKVPKKPSRKEDRMYSVAFTRYLREQGPIGAVRVWFDKGDRPTSYEFYDKKGVLEVVTNNRMRVTYRALQEGKKPSPVAKGEVWIGEDKKTFEPRKIIKMGLAEEDLPGRDGASTGVVVKNKEADGKEGPEYSTIAGMNDPGDRGEEGDGLVPGDYDKASEEGDGEYVEKGTWPTSGAPTSIAPSHTAERRISNRSDKRTVAEADAETDAEKDKKEDDEEKAAEKKDEAHLREKVGYLEGELSKYEALCQEQHETIEALRESARQAEMERARAEAFEKHPELRRVESRLLRCESIEDLNTEVTSLVALVESKRPAPAPVPLVERVAPTANGAHSGASRDGVPLGSLTESSSPFSDRLGAGSRSAVTDVASRVAAHRKRRRGS